MIKNNNESLSEGLKDTEKILRNKIYITQDGQCLEVKITKLDEQISEEKEPTEIYNFTNVSLDF